MTPAAAARDQRGFTLVELIIVIMIIGILSALALPRFINMGSDARQAKAEAILGAVRSASQVVRAASLVRSNTGSSGTVNVDGSSITTAWGYPVATGASGGIADAAGLDVSANNNDQLVFDTTTAPPALYIEVKGATTLTKCGVSYTAPAAANAAPSIAPLDPGYSGC